MPRKLILFGICLTASILMLVYGGFLSRYQVYEKAQTEGTEVAFFDWLREPTILKGTTVGGIHRARDGRIFGTYRDEDERKFCPT